MGAEMMDENPRSPRSSTASLHPPASSFPWAFTKHTWAVRRRKTRRAERCHLRNLEMSPDAEQHTHPRRKARALRNPSKGQEGKDRPAEEQKAPDWREHRELIRVQNKGAAKR